MTNLSKILRRSSIAAWPPSNLSKFESNQSLTWLTRRSTSRLRCDASFSTHSESGMSCRCVSDSWDASREARHISISCGGGCSWSKTAKRATVSSHSTVRSESKFFGVYQIYRFQFRRTRGTLRTLRRSISGSISEYPVANAIGRSPVSDLARCSAMVSIGNLNKMPK